MLIFKLALRNIIASGLRTWLNVSVLSFTYVLIIWHQGLFNGMHSQASREVIQDEIGGGQYWCDGYDPFDPLTLDESHLPIPDPLQSLVDGNQATPILIRQATIYPQGRVQPVLIKGIDPGQMILKIPTADLGDKADFLPVMLGRMMAQKNELAIGDELVIRWRDTHGTFDAVEARIAAIMDTQVPSIDLGQLWVPLDRLQTMYDLNNQATLIVVARGTSQPPVAKQWNFKGYDVLLKDLNDMIKSKRVGSVFMYLILLFLAMLAIFDTQVLSVFRRRKEIGTIMALGLTRTRVIGLFTLEGTIHGILAMGVAAIYGVPLLYWTATKGLPLPGATSEWGFAISARLFPVYSVWLVAGTSLLIMLTVTIVSFLPSRKIAGLKPTDALRGKMS